MDHRPKSHVPVRVLLVDDSVVVRRFLSSVVSKEADLEVAGSAQNGRIALQKLTQLPVDVVIMDVEMPIMDGIEAVARLRVDWPKLPVVMCSSLTARGAEATLRALAAGATDYIAKPSAIIVGAAQEFERELLAKIRALTQRPSVAAVPTARERAPRLVDAVSAPRRNPPSCPSILAIGCSTGGPNALGQLFADLPKALPVPIVVTQHMPPLFTRMLAERLTAVSAIRVKEAAAGDVLLPGQAYIAPGDHHMTFVRRGVEVVVALDQGPPENSCRPAVDAMFRSLATVYGASTIAAVLTGMGRDGAVGARLVTSAGGWVITQGATSCVVPSMPNAVVEIGASSESCELDDLARLLVRRCADTSTRTRVVLPTR